MSNVARRGLLFTLLVTATPCPGAEGGATPAVVERVRQVVEKQYPALETLYTTLHKEPELSLSEEKTARRLAEQLRATGYEVTEQVGGHGVVAVLRNGPGKTLLVRSDLDALPVKEQTGAAYASTAQATSSPTKW